MSNEYNADSETDRDYQDCLDAKFWTLDQIDAPRKETFQEHVERLRQEIDKSFNTAIDAAKQP